MTESGKRRTARVGIASLVVLSILGATAVVWRHIVQQRSPRMLYHRARETSPQKAVRLYGDLGVALPAISEYTALWRAEAMLPDLAAIRALHDVIAARPQSPAAHRAHLVLARHYAQQEAPDAETHYRAALDIEDDVVIRLEMTHHMEERGDRQAAYAEYRRMLRDVPDAFGDMRRIGENPISVASDLCDAYYFTDALETLRGVQDAEAVGVRVRALRGLGRHAEADALASPERLETPEPQSFSEADDAASATGERHKTPPETSPEHPDPTPVPIPDTLDGVLALGGDLEATDPEAAISLYLRSPYVVAWWTATNMLEAQERITESLAVYARVASSSHYLSDDAAYRMHVLAERLGDTDSMTRAEDLLAKHPRNGLAMRLNEGRADLVTLPPLLPEGRDILAKANALDEIGRQDLARLELVLAARFRKASALDLAMGQALLEQGYVVDAQAIGEAYLVEHELAPHAFWELAYPRPYKAAVMQEAETYDIDPFLIWAIMRQESLYDVYAQSYVGARGLMQVMPSTQVWIAEQMATEIPPGDAWSPQTNIHMGAWFLRFLLDYFDQDLERAIPAYNGGAANVDTWWQDPRVATHDDLLRWIDYGETREYVERVGANYAIYRALYAEPPVE